MKPHATQIGTLLTGALLLVFSTTASRADDPRPSPTPAPPVLELRAHLEPSAPYTVGDRLKVIWEASLPRGVKIESDLASLARTAVRQANLEEVLEGTGPSATPAAPVNAQGTVTRVSVEVTAFTTGVHRIPPVTVQYREASGTLAKASTPEMVVPVQTVLTGASAVPRPLKAPVEYPFRFSMPLWAWILLGALVALIAHAVRRWRRPREVTAPPPVPPDVEALARLDALVAGGWPAAAGLKDFCDRLSDILRLFLGRRFHLAAMGETSHELVEGLRDRAILAAQDLGTLTTFLSDCDMVKFARAQPPTEKLENLVLTARTLVESNRPPPPTPESTTRPAAPGPEVAR